MFKQTCQTEKLSLASYTYFTHTLRIFLNPCLPALWFTYMKFFWIAITIWDHYESLIIIDSEKWKVRSQSRLKQVHFIHTVSSPPPQWIYFTNVLEHKKTVFLFHVY